MWPLLGLGVLDATTGIAGPLCGKLLADAGASVTKVEFPGREDPARLLEPVPAWFDFLNVDKRVLPIDPASTAGRAQLDQLLAGSQLYLTSSTHRAAPAGFDCPAVLDRHPHL